MSNKNRHYFAFSLKIFNWIHDGYFLSEITDKKSFLSTEFFPLFPPICPIVIYRDYTGLFYFLFSSRLSVYSFSARPFHVRIFHSRTFHSCGFHARTRTSLHARFNKYASKASLFCARCFHSPLTAAFLSQLYQILQSHFFQNA